MSIIAPFVTCVSFSHSLLGLPRLFAPSIIPNIIDLINLSSCIFDTLVRKFNFSSITLWKTSKHLGLAERK